MSQNNSLNHRDLIEVFDAPEMSKNHVYTFESKELTAQCPFDFGGPDYYKFVLKYTPDDLCIESKSLKKYLESFRDTEVTAEDLGAEMYTVFTSVLEPEELYLRLEQARRGGIEETVEYGSMLLK